MNSGQPTLTWFVTTSESETSTLTTIVNSSMNTA
jgi:hypothetical protein